MRRTFPPGPPERLRAQDDVEGLIQDIDQPEGDLPLKSSRGDDVRLLTSR